jgi:hypothetical protein
MYFLELNSNIIRFPKGIINDEIWIISPQNKNIFKMYDFVYQLEYSVNNIPEHILFAYVKKNNLKLECDILHVLLCEINRCYDRNSSLQIINKINNVNYL